MLNICSSCMPCYYIQGSVCTCNVSLLRARTCVCVVNVQEGYILVPASMHVLVVGTFPLLRHQLILDNFFLNIDEVSGNFFHILRIYSVVLICYDPYILVALVLSLQQESCPQITATLKKLRINLFLETFLHFYLRKTLSSSYFT